VRTARLLRTRSLLACLLLGQGLTGLLCGCDGDPTSAPSRTNEDSVVPDGPSATDASGDLPDHEAGATSDASAPARSIAVSDTRATENLGFYPEDANPQAVRWHDQQQVGRFRRELAGDLLPVRAKLVVTLNGVGTPAGPSEVAQWLADRGFHTLTLDYRNTTSVRLLEDSVPGDNMPGSIEAYSELIEGVDYSLNIEVPRIDSVFGRIESALQFLSVNDPGADWGYYLNPDGSVRLSDLMFFGYSFGSATSTVIGKRHRVARIVAAAGPRYALEVATEWLQEPAETPVQDCYGIFGVLDPDFADFVATTDILGWPGEVIDTTVTAPPYDNSHRLQTNEGHSTMCFGTELNDVCEYAFGISQ